MARVETLVRPRITYTESVNPASALAPAERPIQRTEKTAGEAPSVYMADGIVYEWGTRTRVVRSPIDFSMFDGNNDIGAKRAVNLPKEILIVKNRKIVPEP